MFINYQLLGLEGYFIIAFTWNQINKYNKRPTVTLTIEIPKLIRT